MQLALLMRAGALAAPMDIVEERTVGPSLGKENIDKGFNSVFYGFIVLAIFMCAYYMLMGLISTIALSVNLLLLVAIFAGGWFRLAVAFLVFVAANQKKYRLKHFLKSFMHA